jgi:hypothetical protein
MAVNGAVSCPEEQDMQISAHNSISRLSATSLNVARSKELAKRADGNEHRSVKGKNLIKMSTAGCLHIRLFAVVKLVAVRLYRFARSLVEQDGFLKYTLSHTRLSSYNQLIWAQNVRSIFERDVVCGLLGTKLRDVILCLIKYLPPRFHGGRYFKIRQKFTAPFQDHVPS